MDRIAILKALIADRFGGSQAEFARKIKRTPGQVGQWLGGHRALGDAGARIIEMALELPQGYFDRASSVEEQRAAYGVEVAKIPKQRDAITEEIIKIISATDDTGRAMALAAIKVALHGHNPAKENTVG